MTETTIAPTLVSILLLALLASSGPAVGTVPVTHDGVTVPHGDYDYDATLTSGAVHWQGQQLYLQGNASEGSFDLHEVDQSGNSESIGEFVETVRLDDEAATVFDTASVSPGEYVLVAGDDQLVRTNERGVQVGTVDPADSGAFADAGITIAEQDFEITPEREDAVLRDSFEFTVDSNRGEYDVEIRSGGIDTDDLQRIFGGTETEDGTRVAVTSDELQADLSDVDPGQYTVTFDVIDVDASSSVTISVSEPRDMSFADDNVRAAIGDQPTINVTMESGASGQLVAGSPDNGYEATIGFEDSDHDGDVSLTMNTYLAGNHTGGGERAAWSADDGDEITAVELATEPLDEQLDPTNYDLAVRSGGQQQDIGMLVLGDPTVSNLTLWTAPAQHFGEPMDETTRTRTDRVAVGDLLIAEINGEGVFGLLERQSGEDVTERFRSLVQSRNASFWLELQDENRATDPPRTDLDESFANDAFHVISDPENQTLYIAMDEESLRFEKGRSSVQPGDSYEVLFELRDDSGVVSTDQVVRSTVAFSDRSATFETGEGDQLWLPAAGNATINGSTTVAPGTEFYFRLRLNGTLSEALEATVQSNRTFAVPVDLSETTPGTNVSVDLRDFEAKARGAIRESWSEPTEPTTPTAEPPVTTVLPTTSVEPTDVRDAETTAEPTDESTPTPDTRTAATASNDVTESTSQATTEDGPGFTAGIAALAVAGFALLLGRRRSD